MKNIKDIPALPEDAEEISYKEKCKKDQYETMTKTNNTWNIEHCPSPCERNGDCTEGASCIDHRWISDQIKNPNKQAYYI